MSRKTEQIAREVSYDLSCPGTCNKLLGSWHDRLLNNTDEVTKVFTFFKEWYKISHEPK